LRGGKTRICRKGKYRRLLPVFNLRDVGHEASSAERQDKSHVPPFVPPHQYYSRGFPVRGRVAAQRLALLPWVRGGGLLQAVIAGGARPPVG
jgi:hypothetical protein